MCIIIIECVYDCTDRSEVKHFSAFHNRLEVAKTVQNILSINKYIKSNQVNLHAGAKLYFTLDTSGDECSL